MCLIKFWIINIPTRTVQLEREFPINLVKAKKKGFNGDLSNVKLKDRTNFVNSVFVALGLESERRIQPSDTDWKNSSQADQLEYYDFSSNNKLPVIELNLDDTYSIWPLIIIEQNKNLFCGLPLVHNDSKDLIDHLSISIGFSTLKSLINFYSKENRSKLELFISTYLPFGQLISFPIDLSKNSLLSLSTKNKKQEAIIFIRINENISSSSLDKELIFGSITIENNESLGNCNRDNSSLQVRLNQAGSKMIHYLCDDKLFRPFIVYDYTVTRSSTQKLVYKIDLQINVNMNMTLNTNFSYFNVVFANGFVDKSARVLNSTPNFGQLSLEKTGLTWSIGSKLPKSLILKVSLDAVCDRSDLNFTDACLSFQTENFNYAFPKLNMDNLQILNANQKAKLVTEINFCTVNYKLKPNLK